MITRLDKERSTFTKYLTRKKRVNFKELQKEIQELQKFNNTKKDISEIDKIAYGI